MFLEDRRGASRGNGKRGKGHRVWVCFSFRGLLRIGKSDSVLSGSDGQAGVQQYPKGTRFENCGSEWNGVAAGGVSTNNKGRSGRH